MYPHERSLVSRLKDKPFALLGINSDASREALKPILEREQITWRSWFDGSGGPIAKAWKVQGWPTMYIVDHKGVIRKEYLGSPGGEVLDKEIDALLAEAEQAMAAK